MKYPSCIILLSGILFLSCADSMKGTLVVSNETSTDTNIDFSDNSDRVSRTVKPFEEISYEYDQYCFVFLSQEEVRKLLHKDGDKRYIIRDKQTFTETMYFTNLFKDPVEIYNTKDVLTGVVSIPAYVVAPADGDPDNKNYAVSIMWMLGLDLQVQTVVTEPPIVETKIENGKKYVLIREPGYLLP